MKDLLRDNQGFFLRNFNFDFSEIHSSHLRKINTSLNEIISVFENQNAQKEHHSDYEYIIGFSKEGKFVHIIYQYSEIDANLVHIKQVDLPSEKDIGIYFKRKK